MYTQWVLIRHHSGSTLSYFLEHKHIKQLISNGPSKACKYHGVSRFINYVCDINDGNEFRRTFKDISPKELEPKV